MRRRLGNGLTIAAAVLLWAGMAAPLAAQEHEKAAAYSQAFLYWQFGTRLHMLGEYRSAVAQFEQSIELYPTAEGHTYLGWSLSELGRLEDAIAECETAITLDPDYGNPYNDIGVYLIELDRAEEAAPWLEKAIAAGRYCFYQYPHFNLGRIFLIEGRIDAARRAFERALEIDPGYLLALQGLALIREHGETL